MVVTHQKAMLLVEDGLEDIHQTKVSKLLPGEGGRQPNYQDVI